MDAEKGPLDHYGSDLKEMNPSDSFICRISFEGVFQEHTLTNYFGEVDVR
jgi:hypothetical protein